MYFDEIVRGISQECPKFNHMALRDFTKQQIDDSPEFIATVLREGFKLVNADLELVDYEIMSPEARAKFELGVNNKITQPKNRHSGELGVNAAKTIKRIRIPLCVSHLRLVRYRIRFQKEYFYISLYTPYMFRDMLCIKDKRSIVRKIILEKALARVKDKGNDGVSVSPIRVNINFNRAKTFQAFSYTTNACYRHFVVTTRLFFDKSKRKRNETSILHYMLAQFGVNKTLHKFGIKKGDISFVAEVGEDTEKFEYFAAKRYDERAEFGPGIYLRVNKTLLAEDQTLKFVINMLYVLSHFKIQTMENVYDADNSVWKIILGMLTLASEDQMMTAYSKAETLLRGIGKFIDPITSRRFVQFGIPIKDTYDLLVYVFGEIDAFMANNLPQDLYNSRIDVTNGVLVNGFAHTIFTKLYPLDKISNIKIDDIVKALKLSAMMFFDSGFIKPDKDKSYIAPPEIYSDNFLLSGGLNKIRLGGKAEQRLDPSMVVVESTSAFVGKYIGKTGHLNPYVPIDEVGGIQRPDYAQDIDILRDYLPK